MTTHIVTKPLSTSKGVLPIGTPVDASDWQFTRQLEEQRYIKPIDRVNKPEAKTKRADN